MQSKPKKPKSATSSSFFSFRRALLVVLLAAGVFIGITIFSPCEIEPIVFELPELVELSEELAPNNFLNLSRIVFPGIKGAESLAYDPKTKRIYTGTADGKIVELGDNMQSKIFASLAPEDCSNETTCGRPLGMRIDPFNRRLIVADAYLGLFAISLGDQPGKVTKLFPTPAFKTDFTVTLIDAVEIISDGVFAVTESSTKMHLNQLTAIVLEGSATGKVYLIDTKRNKFETIAENLAFPNGIQLLKDNKTLIVAETMRQRILSIDLESRKVGLFSDRIPGMPDNIRESPSGGYWVGIVSASYVGSPGLFYTVREWPLARMALHKLIPSRVLQSVGLQKHIISIRLDEQGQVIESLHGQNVPGLSVVEILELTNGTLFFGSYRAESEIRRLDRSEIKLN